MSTKSGLLTEEELIEITGYEFPSCQCRELKKSGFSFHVRRDGRPQLTWEHYNAVLNGIKSTSHTHEIEPDFNAI